MSPPSGPTAQQTAVVQSQVRQANFLSRMCSYCDTEFLLGPGDAIYGDRWYHGDCWDKLRGKQADVSKTG